MRVHRQQASKRGTGELNGMLTRASDRVIVNAILIHPAIKRLWAVRNGLRRLVLWRLGIIVINIASIADAAILQVQRSCPIHKEIIGADGFGCLRLGGILTETIQEVGQVEEALSVVGTKIRRVVIRP